jgi:tetratricopeptide (TPR) repeat protein
MTFLTFVVAAVAMVASVAPLSAQALRPNAMLASGDTPAQRKIAMARASIARDAKHAQGHVDLALALTQRARETADPVYYQQAEAAVQAALAISPDNFEALKVRTWALLGQHQFAAAHALATTLNTRVPDDLMVYGMLTDANIELGRYDDAETSAQWMLDLRPGNIPALTRAAYLRELFGDIEGAIELMRSAVNRMPFQETEDRAWVMTQIGHLELVRRQPTAAESALEEALALFPDYHYALGTLAEVRTAQKRHREAAMLQRQRYEVAPHPENLYELAEAQARAGMMADAAKSYRQFEAGARAEMKGDDNANRELIAYWAGAGKKPAEALKLAEQEIARRGDVYTREAYAWALFKSGRRADARREIAKALAVGVRHPRLLERAAAIQGKATTAATPAVAAAR